MASSTYLKQSREGNRTNAKKIINLVNQFWDSRDSKLPDYATLTIKSESLNKFETNIERLNAEISVEILDSEATAESQKCIDFQETIYETQSKISMLFDMIKQSTDLNQENPNGSLHNTNQSHMQFLKAKLPKLNLPSFDGNPIKYQEFWDSFDSTIHSTEMPDIDKFKYLKTCLHGNAAKMVDGFRLISANYSTVIEALKNRFGNPEVAIFAHFEHLLNIKQSNTDTSSLQATQDECEKHIRSLIALGLEENTFGLVFTPIILSKLPWPIRVELHRKNGSQPWSLANLRNLLSEEIKARQMGEWTLGENSSKSQPGFSSSKPIHNPQNKSASSQRLQATSSFMQNARVSELKITCVFCNAKHFSDQCKKITSYDARKKAVQTAKRCFKCLSNQHMLNSCRKQTKCFHCSSDSHHSSLCQRRYGVSQGQGSALINQTSRSDNVVGKSAPSNSSPVAPQNLVSNAALPNSYVYMQTAVLTLKGPKALQIPARIYLDSGSSCSYITTKLVRQLGLQKTGEVMLSNARFEDSFRRKRPYPMVSLSLPTIDDSEIPISAFVTDTIACPLLKPPLDAKKFPVLSQLPLADPLCSSPEFHSIDILIGIDFYFDIVGREQLRLDGGLILLGSKFGYITTGKVSDDSAAVRFDGSFVNSFLLHSSVCLQETNLDRFWSLEDIGIRDDAAREDDDFAVEQFNKSIHIVDGRYEVGWPWKNNEVELPTNYSLAFCRLRSLVKSVQANASVLELSNRTIEDQLSNGIIEEVSFDTASDSSGRTHYLPHHCVIKSDRSTTKLRIVYDASSKSKYKSCSLNDCLLRGPVFLGDICGLLLRFRNNPIAITCDIEKAFLQVGLSAKDRDVTRFLWLHKPAEPVSAENVRVFRFKRVPFGVISSPFLLAATIKHHLNQCNTVVANHIQSNIYVDNIIGGASSAEDSKDYYSETKQLFTKIAMNAREWFSNSAELNQFIPEHDRGAGDITKVLGMEWDTRSDTISCVTAKFSVDNVKSKRQLFQQAARLYDPCGLISPVIVRLKMLIQTVWKLKLQWDDALPPDIIDEWSKLAADCSHCHQIKVPRFIKIESAVCQIHCFVDASRKAYAAAVYLQSNYEASSIKLIFAKTRLAPLKPVSLPRLELMAAVIGVRMVEFVLKEIQIPVTKTTIWSDSKCVLHWIRSNKVLATFIRNRVQEIKGHDHTLRYVPTELNPADLPSRGTSVFELQKSTLWWNGPLFLQLPADEWPPVDPLLADGSDTEVPTETTLVATTNPNYVVAAGPFGIDSSRFSSMKKLLFTTAWINRFIQNLKARMAQCSCETSRVLTSSEVTASRLAWVFQVQSRFRSTNQRQFENLKRQLDVFDDRDGIFRCGGRMKNSELSDETKFPILLPKNNHFTKLTIQQCHQDVFHMGVSHTLAELRSRYWVPCGRSQVQSVVKGCQICRLWEGSHYKTPPFAPLPRFRVTQTVPFSHTGVDYLGPLVVSDAGTSSKVWIALFTCSSTRAIHLEVVPDSSTEQFLLSFRRFIACHGKPSLMISDNGKYFKLANTVLNRLWLAVINDPALHQFSAENEIVWQFIPEYAPWMGGFYERLVASVKRSLKKTLGRRCMTLIQLQTVVAEVANILNNRPLVICADITDQVLTPANLLGQIRRNDGAFNVTSVDEFQPKQSLAVRLVSVWKEQNQVLKQFWKISGKRITSRRFGNPIRWCAIPEDNLPRSVWKVAVIDHLHQSRDGICRSASVRTSAGKLLIRPLKFLYPIESSLGDNGEVGPQLTDSRSNRKSSREVGPVLTDSPSRRAVSIEVGPKLIDSPPASEVSTEVGPELTDAPPCRTSSPTRDDAMSRFGVDTRDLNFQFTEDPARRRRRAKVAAVSAIRRQLDEESSLSE